MSIVDIKQGILRQSDLLADVAHELNESRRLAAMQADIDKVLAHCNYLASLLTELGGDELVPGIIQMTKSGKIGSSPETNIRTNQ